MTFIGWAMPKWLTFVISWRLKKASLHKTEYINCLPTLFIGFGKNPQNLSMLRPASKKKKKRLQQTNRRLIQRRGDLPKSCGMTQHPLSNSIQNKIKRNSHYKTKKKQANSKFHTQNLSRIRQILHKKPFKNLYNTLLKPYKNHVWCINNTTTSSWSPTLCTSAMTLTAGVLNKWT